MTRQILLNPIGSGGDVFPFVALGVELQRRGHSVKMLTNPIFREPIQSAGLEFVEIGTDAALKEVGNDPRLHSPRHSWKLALRWGSIGTMRQTFESIRSLVERRPHDTTLVASPLSFGARFFSETQPVPLATMLLSPFVLRSEYESPVIRPLVLNKWVPKWNKRIQYWVADRFFVDRQLREANTYRHELGLKHQSRFCHRWCFSQELNLAMFWEVFAKPQPDWPQNLKCVGPVHWDPPPNSATCDHVNSFIEKCEKKPIVVLAGSAGPASWEFYRNWMHACRRLKRNLILLERKRRVVPNKIPEHVCHANYYPVDKLLGRVAAIAHCGGVGVTLQSLAAGVPQLVMPQVNDQPDNAARVLRLRVGKVLAKQLPSREEIVEKMSELISDSSIRKRCIQVRDEIPSQDSVALACDLIEGLGSKPR